MTISVIIPVYNVKPYLRQCLDSVIHQTYEDLEIIIVDDGSTDGSEVICDEYKGKDSRIRVIHQDNRDLSAARNAGLDIATGDFIMFVDSDDWVEPEFCELPYRAAVENDADIVIFQYWRHKDDRTEKWGALDCEGLKDNQQAMWILCSGLNTAAWNKLYRKNCFTNARFPVGKYYEDSVLTTSLVHDAQRIYFMNIPLYHYRHRKGSITTSKDRKILDDCAEMTLERAKLLKRWGYFSAAEKRVTHILWGYLLSVGNRAKYSEACREYILGLNAPPDEFPWHSKAMWHLLKHSPTMFDAMCVFTGKRK